MIPTARSLGVLAALSLPLLTTSCMENEKDKAVKLDALLRENAEIEQSIENMNKKIASVTADPEAQRKSLEWKNETETLKLKEGQMDGLIEALTVRRDGLKVKLDNFRISHPIE